ncbi:MAG: arsenate reductase family protein [Spirochaetaceae bacterium]|nr:arsenate reductase family protein [Spirochaetaceae bacterium]
MKFICYPKCSTCAKARIYLENHQLNFIERNIKENRPTEEELREWHNKSGLPLKRFFNTSGMLYRELHLKDKLNDMNEDEMYKLLSTDGMLVKRPILVKEDTVLVGFKEKEWVEKL